MVVSFPDPLAFESEAENLSRSVVCQDGLLNVSLLGARVRRDPGTRPVPNIFSSTRPVPTRPDPKIEINWVLGN